MTRSISGIILFAFIAATSALQSVSEPEGENRLGRVMFFQCASCHALKDESSSLVGPTLRGLFGAQAGERPDYDSSHALRSLDVVWDDETLDAFLTSPRKYAPGNRMAFYGIASSERRSALIAYLREETSDSD